MAVDWYPDGMRTAIDKAGRIVVPKPLRDAVGMTPGEVDIEVDGATLRISPVSPGGLVERGGRLVIDTDVVLTDEDVALLRRVDQR